jgi:SAM-dependent methyltransferase
VTGPRTTIIIPAFNHGAYLAAAVASALAQTAPVDIIVVDDGSTDDTPEIIERSAWPGTFIRQAHRGPSAARNAGLEVARGEYVMFLDADDTIEPTKVADQLAEFDDQVGWVMCDVRIEDEARRRTENASERYRYPQRQLGGWIREQLQASNFIPIMSPLIRRSVLADDIRFSEDLTPEDWHFWYAVAGRARVRYLPKVLATYRKRRTGRSRLELPNMAPRQDGPLLLNLGCGTPNSPSWHPMPGFVNLDKSMGWMFEDLLPQCADGTVDGISISHSLMYVDERDWPRVFAEFARVLKRGGVVRITEDHTIHPVSSRKGGWKGSEPAVTLTHPSMVGEFLLGAGFEAHLVDGRTSRYRDLSLCQAQHGDPPHVFFMEGVKP